MSQELIQLLTTSPTTGVAVGGALLAVALGYTAVKTLGTSEKKTSGTSSASKKKKTKSSTTKKKGSKKKNLEVDAESVKVESEQINLDEFVGVRIHTELNCYVFSNMLISLGFPWYWRRRSCTCRKKESETKIEKKV